MTGKLIDLKVNIDGSQSITLKVDTDCREMMDKFKDALLDINIKKVSGHRSIEANNYLWHLCSEIAKASSKYATDGKNDVYRDAILAKGEYDELLVREEAVDSFIKRWGKKGTGWFAEVVDDYYPPADEFSDVMGDCKGPRKIVHAYYGSSTYSVASMSKVIDYLVIVANDAGIPTMTEKDKEKMLIAWGKKVGENDEQVNTSAR